MKNYKILVTESKNLSEETRNKIKKIGKVDFLETNQIKLKSIVKDYDIIIVGLSLKIDRFIINNAKKLKYIISPSTGLNHLDLEELKKKKIKVFSLSNEKSFLKKIPATAEHTFALTLNLLRNINKASLDVNNGNWNRKKFIGTELFKKKIGIVGFGRIGKIVKKFALAFGMKVYFYDPLVKSSFKDAIKINKLEKLAAISDIFTIHAPSIPKNKKLISKQIFKNFKKDSIIINTSRGDIIDEDQLLCYLEKKRIKGAALDVLNNEYEIIKKSNLVKFAKKNDNLIITPHIAGYTYESLNKTYQFTVRKLEKYLNEFEYL